MDVGLLKKDVCKTKNKHGKDFKRNKQVKVLIKRKIDIYRLLWFERK